MSGGEEMASQGYRPDIRTHKGIQEANVKDALRKQGQKGKKGKFDPDYRKIGILAVGIILGLFVVYQILRYYGWI